MLPIKEWYWDPKREEKIQITEELNQIKEVKIMGWERLITTICVIVAEEVARHYLNNDKDLP